MSCFLYVLLSDSIAGNITPFLFLNINGSHSNKVFISSFFLTVGAAGGSVVGGTVAKPHSRPYMASLQIDDHHTCGGVLVRKDYVLTAAHCKNCYRDLTVVLGAHNICKKEKSQQKIKVKKYQLHPKYTGKFDYDIMLLKLENNAKLDKYVGPIELPETDEHILANVSCAVAGWGQSGPKKPTSDVLKEANEKIQFSVECNHIWKENFTSHRMICTKITKGGGVCQGDSGGPLICNGHI
nr:mast cell protease 4-like [Nothobranchius furzeri]